MYKKCLDKEVEEDEIKRDWWKTIFDGLYLVTDARSVMSDELTAREMDFVLEFTGATEDWDILDLCGGQGRHAQELFLRGFEKALVYDYSNYLVNYGKEKCGGNICFLRGDARNVGVKDGSFDLVTIMGNSFGYFPEDDENLKILEEAMRVLKGGGIVLLDVIDRDYIEKNFRPRSVHNATLPKSSNRNSVITVTRSRRIEGNIVCSREVVKGEDGGVLKDNRYCERLFCKEEITALLNSVGFGGVTVEMGRAFHERPGDFGFMENRMMIKGKKV